MELVIIDDNWNIPIPQCFYLFIYLFGGGGGGATLPHANCELCLYNMRYIITDLNRYRSFCLYHVAMSTNTVYSKLITVRVEDAVHEFTGEEMQQNYGMVSISYMVYTVQWLPRW